MSELSVVQSLFTEWDLCRGRHAAMPKASRRQDRSTDKVAHLTELRSIESRIASVLPASFTDVFQMIGRAHEGTWPDGALMPETRERILSNVLQAEPYLTRKLALNDLAVDGAGIAFEHCMQHRGDAMAAARKAEALLSLVQSALGNEGHGALTQGVCHALAAAIGSIEDSMAAMTRHLVSAQEGAAQAEAFREQQEQVQREFLALTTEPCATMQ